MTDPETVTIPDDLAARWRAARDEMIRANLSLTHPRPDDSFADMSAEVSAAHDTMADLYTELATTHDVPDMIAAAATTAAESHRAMAAAERERDYAW